MRTLYLSIVILAIPVFLEAQTSPVSVRKTKTGEIVILARPLQKAVHDFDSGFVPLTSSDYIKALREKPRLAGGGYLSFCTGDFDGNGLIDAVLLGRSGGGMRLIMAFQQKKNHFSVLKIKDFPFFVPGEEDAFVSKVPAYTLNVTAEKRTLSFNTDTILLTYYRRGSFLYSWNVKEFLQYQLVQ